MFENGWSRGDALTAWGVGVALAMGAGSIWAALFSPQFQDWWRQRLETGNLITLGSLGNATPCNTPLAPGVIAADRKTVQVLLDAFSEVDMYWLHTYDFAGSFRRSKITTLRKYAWNNDRPEHEFIDRELERMGGALKKAIVDFGYLVGHHTTATYRDDEDEMLRIPAQYVDGEYSDEKRRMQAQEINNAAEAVFTTYSDLVRRARLKLALSAPPEAE
jgi:hypothetical protein